MNDDQKGMIFGAIGVVIFGLTLPATRIAVAELNFIFVGLGRALVAAVLAAIVLAVTRQPLPTRRQFAQLAVTAAGIILGFPILATLAMKYASAGHGGIVLAILPLATAAASTVFAGERPSPGFWLSAAAGSGAVLVFALLDGAGSGSVQLADLALVGAVASAAIGYAQGGALSRSLGGWQVICWALVLSAPILAAIVWAFSGPIDWSASWPAWASFIYVAIFSQFIGFFAWNTGLALGGVARVGQLQLLQTFVTLAGAALLSGEKITLLQLGFALLVVAIVAWGRQMKVVRNPL